MFGLVKIAGLSAVLAAGVVNAFEAPSAPERAPIAGQKFADRLPQSEGEIAVRRTAAETTGSVTTMIRESVSQMRTVTGKSDFQRVASAGCAAQTWPNISHDCLTSVDGTPVRQAVRTITVEERRDAERTSTLDRMPAAEIARR